MAGDDSQERTQDATPKRMKENREKGKLQKSQDITTWFTVAAAGIVLPLTINTAIGYLTTQMFTIAEVAKKPDAGVAVKALEDGMASILPTISVMLAVVFLTAIAGYAVQGGIHVKKFTPKFEQFHPVNGLKRVFGFQAMWNGVKSLAKTVAVGIVLYTVIQGLLPVLTSSGSLTLTTIINAAMSGVSTLIVSAVAVGLVLAAADLFVIMKKNQKQTKMTLKEVKDENKNTDGDPLIKGQRRSRQMAMSRNRMMSSIKDADVVLVNPTQFAVALKYEPGKSAPRIVAKGSGVIAARIREEAETQNVPMVKDIPLTRALHKACEIGQEIPAEFYNSVALVLTFVAALKKRGTAKGVHTMSAPSYTPGK